MTSPQSQPANPKLIQQAINAANAGSPGPNASPSTLSSILDTRDKLRESCMRDLYVLCKGVLGFRDLDPVLHRRMCDRAQDRSANRQLHLWPRDHFKTSVYSIGLPIFEYINDHEQAILLAGSTATNASRRLRRIEGVFERNRVFRWLFPECIPGDFNKRWNQEEALCPRKEDRVEPTFDTIGVGGKVTGRHYTTKIVDDVVDETCLGPDGLPSKVAMDAAIQWLDYSEYLLESEATSRDINVGTRWAKEDPHGHIIKDGRYVVERHSADGGCCDLHPAGQPIFPATCRRCDSLGPHDGPGHKIMGFTREYLAVLQQKDPFKYACQMRNNPTDSAITEFKKSWVQNFLWVEDGQAVMLGPRRVQLGSCNSYLIIDPAFTRRAKNDPTGFLVAAMTPTGQHLILDAHECRLDPVELVDAIYAKWRRWKPYEVIAEEVAGAKFITPFLKARADQDSLYIRCRGVQPGGNSPKLARIRGLVGPYSRMEVWIAPGLLEFVNQLLDFPSSRDHLLDCQAMLMQEGRKPFSEEDSESASDEDYRITGGMNPVTGY